MIRAPSCMLILLLAGNAALAAAPEPPLPGEPTLPATDLNRESNNPAKAAIKARQAQEADQAREEEAKAEDPAAPAGPVADGAQLLLRVEAALRSDARTAKLGVSARLDAEKLIGLYGSVPSAAGRSAAIDVAAKVAGAARVKSHLTVRRAK